MADDATELQHHYEARFLVWLLRESGGREQVRVPVPAATGAAGREPEIPAQDLAEVADLLEEHGLIEVHERRDRIPAEASLRTPGLRRARYLLAERENAAARRGYAENAVLTWAWQNRAGAAAGGYGFLDDVHVLFHGEPLAEEEVLEAVDYLQRKSLLAPRGAGLDGPVELTDTGLDCARSGIGVSAFVEQQDKERNRAPSIQVTVHGDAYVGSTVVISHPIDFPRLVAQMSDVLGLDEEQLRTLREDAGDLRTAVDAQQEPGRIRRLADSVRRQLEAAPDTMGRQLLLDLARQALTNLTN